MSGGIVKQFYTIYNRFFYMTQTAIRKFASAKVSK